jgi:hypothetical protein
MDRDGSVAEGTASGRAGLKLAVAAASCLVAAGLLLWWREGGDVFSHLVTTAMSWCL